MALHTVSIDGNLSAKFLERSKRSKEPRAILFANCLPALIGPKDLRWENSAEAKNKWWGWQILRLTKRDYLTNHYESISIYGNLFDRTQRTAIVRVSTWHYDTTRLDYKANGQDITQIAIPVCYREIPVPLTRKLMRRFATISLPIFQSLESESLIRTIRISYNHQTDVVERTWRMSDTPTIDKLNARWEKVWLELLDTLTTPTTYLAIKENFDHAAPVIKYDLGMGDS